MVVGLAVGALAPAALAASRPPPELDGEPPRQRALLEQGWSVESGESMARNEALALALYCEAAGLGSSEGLFRVGLLLLDGPAHLRNPEMAAFFFSMASEMGHLAASGQLEGLAIPPPQLATCLTDEKAYLPLASFDFQRYLDSMSDRKKRIVAIIRRLAPQFGVDEKLAVAVAGVESNFDPQALSPKNAMGVMQLIPDTARRFNVANALDPEQNIRGGLAYLRWLHKRFAGDLVRVVAAYNAGEGNVEVYRGVPPFRETQRYVWRVLQFAGKHGQLPMPR